MMVNLKIFKPSTICCIVSNRHHHHHIKWEGLVGGACDFKGKDLKKVQTSQGGDPPSKCRRKCRMTDACTHYVWTDQNGGTCYLKKGVQRNPDLDVFQLSNQKVVKHKL